MHGSPKHFVIAKFRSVGGSTSMSDGATNDTFINDHARVFFRSDVCDTETMPWDWRRWAGIWNRSTDQRKAHDAFARVCIADSRPLVVFPRMTNVTIYPILRHTLR